MPLLHRSLAVARRFLCVAFATACLSLTVSAGADDEDPECSRTGRGGPGDSQGSYPYGVELGVLARDLTSSEYREVLETMIPTDLEAEWLRVATPDNYVTFEARHGGSENVLADPELKAAYLSRKEIADRFIELMRGAYRQRNSKPPFDDEDKVAELLATAAERNVSTDPALNVPVRVVMPAPGAERQWPRLRGPSGQGAAVESDFPLTWSATENIAWKTPLPGRGNSSPVVWDDKIVLTSASEDGAERLLLCYARADGRPLWQRHAPQPSTVENLYWKNSYASSTPVTDGERIIAFFGNSGLVCYDFEGKLQWQHSLGEFVTMHGPGTSPVLYKEKMIFLQDQNRGESVFVALDKRTGELIWQQHRENNMCWSTPVIVRAGDRDELVYNGSHYVVGYDPDTGEELWRVAGSSREAIPMIVVGGGLLYSTSGRNGPTFAIRPGGSGDVTETHVHWKASRGGPHVPSPAYFEDRLFIVNDTGIMTCLDARDGSLKWQNRLRGRFSMSPVEAGGRLILTSEAGLTYVLRAADKLDVLAENDLGEPNLATPAVLGGRVYFRTASNLVCVGEDR